jgi:arylsulfatase
MRAGTLLVAGDACVVTLILSLNMEYTSAVNTIEPGPAPTQPRAARQPDGRSSAARPNIVLILVDDMGYSDIGCYGSEIRTPHLDRLAAGGLRLTQMYNSARCCPTRASLLTGLYPHQAGVGHMVRDLGAPGYQGYLNDRCVTIAEALRSAGYRTFMSGKWHVGGQYSTDPEQWRVAGSPTFPTPLQRGFERFYGTLAGAGSYYHPHTLMRDGKFIEAQGEDYYYTDAIGEQAAAMIDDAARDGAPFFLYVAYTSPHWPLHAPPEDVARYRGRYRAGWDALRRERHARLKALGLLAGKWELSPRDELAPAWDDLPDWPDKDWEDARMAVYAAQVDRMDQSVGRILAALERHGLDDNTLVMFLSDNGGCAEFLREDGTHQSAPPLTRDGRRVRAGNIKYLLPGPADTYMSYDLPWANASNTPFRLYKHWVHEGGIATPFIAWWPRVIPAGGIAHSPCHLIDVMATCLDAAGAPYPERSNDKPVQPLEGESLLPLFHGDLGWERQRPLCWEHEGNRAVRQGRWKLVSRYPGSWELYDMEEDRTELHDLSSQRADKVRELAAIYDAWAERCGVLPWDQIRPRRPR